MANHKWEIPEGFTNRLREALRIREMTGESLAFDIGIEPTNIYKYLNGKTCMNIGRLAEICEILDVSADWLLFGKGNIE